MNENVRVMSRLLSFISDYFAATLAGSPCDPKKMSPFREKTSWKTVHQPAPRHVSRAVENSFAVYQTTRDSAAGFLNDAKMDVNLTQTIQELEAEMIKAAEDRQFEKAALLRDRLKELKRMLKGKKAEEKPKSKSYRKSMKSRR
jgi:excinuclease ABC subunit B